MNRKLVMSLVVAIVLGLGVNAGNLEWAADVLSESAVLAEMGTEWGGG